MDMFLKTTFFCWPNCNFFENYYFPFFFPFHIYKLCLFLYLLIHIRIHLSRIFMDYQTRWAKKTAWDGSYVIKMVSLLNYQWLI